MTLIYCPDLTCIKKGWQYHNLVDFQVRVKLDSFLLPDICKESSECHTGLRNSNLHYSGGSAFQVGEFNKKFLSIHSDSWFIERFSGCWLVNNICRFCVDCEILTVRLDPWPLHFASELAFLSISCA